MRRHPIAALLCLLPLAGCDPSDGDARGASPASAVLADAKRTAADIREQTPGGSPAVVAVETTASGGPKRRDGWWEMSAEGAVKDTQNLCVGAGSEDGWSIYDQLLFSSGDCSKKALTRQGAGWSYELVCDMSGTALTSQGRISGDFRDSFRVEQSGTVDGAPRSAVIRGAHRGACPAGFKPGDVVSGGAVLFNALDF